MEHFGVLDIHARIGQYAAGKQEHVVRHIEQGRFMAFAELFLEKLRCTFHQTWTPPSGRAIATTTPAASPTAGARPT
jgi:hypothetical protein